MTASTKIQLIALGYWKATAEDEFVFPQELPQHDYSPETLRLLSSYFRQARRVEAYMGLSWCRFRCGVENSGMGCAENSDGEYVWPQGYPHYVLSHGVALPEPFLEKILASGDRCQDAFEVIPRRAGRAPPLGPDQQPYLGGLFIVDFSFWIEWCRGRSNGDKSLTDTLRQQEIAQRERQASEHRQRLVDQYGEDLTRHCVFAECDGHALRGKAVCWRHHG